MRSNFNGVKIRREPQANLAEGWHQETSDDPELEAKAQEVIERSRRVEYDSARSEGTAKADGRVELKVKARKYEGEGATKEEADKLVGDGNGLKKRSIRDLFSLEPKPTDFSCGCGHPVFDELRVQEDNGDWDVRFKYNPEGSLEDAIDKKEERPSELIGKPTPKLDKLEERESGVSKRYVFEFLNVYKGSNYQIPGDIVPYLEHRAARKLGMTTEGESIAKYSRVSGISGLSKPLIDVYDSVRLVGESRVRIPDIYKEGVVIGDVKDVQSISNTQQMKDYVAIINGKATYHGEDEAIANKPVKFDLVLRASKDGTVAGTHVSGPLKQSVEDNGGKIYEII